jgi:uncharacterized protein (DUF486 family)
MAPVSVFAGPRHAQDRSHRRLAAVQQRQNLSDRPWLIAALVSWGIVFFEYLFQVPANRIGHEVLNIGQLKILQEVITLLVFVPFALFYLKERLTLDCLWAGLCLLGAVFFLFRARLFA